MDTVKNGAMGSLVFREAFLKNEKGQTEHTCQYIGKNKGDRSGCDPKKEATGSHQFYITHTNTAAADKTDPFQKPAAENSALYTQ